MTCLEKKINVIDLDRTLLPYSSLLRYLWMFRWEWRFVRRLLLDSVLRATWLISTDEYIMGIMIAARRTPDYEHKVERFGLSLQKDIRGPIMDLILKNTDGSTTNVICTGSPEDYVKYLSKALGWQHMSTTLSDDLGRFVHMSGKNKTAALKERYPKQRYAYNLAISDNRADGGLLKKFDRSYRIKNRMFTHGFRSMRVK